MKFALKKYWIVVALLIIANVFLFVLLSNKLESFVYEKITENSYLE